MNKHTAAALIGFYSKIEEMLPASENAVQLLAEGGIEKLHHNIRDLLVRIEMKIANEERKMKTGFDMGQRVRLANEEGLDLPDEHMGEVGVVVRVTRFDEYVVRMSNGDEVYCAYYHLEPVAGAV